MAPRALLPRTVHRTINKSRAQCRFTYYTSASKPDTRLHFRRSYYEPILRKLHFPSLYLYIIIHLLYEDIVENFYLQLIVNLK